MKQHILHPDQRFINEDDAVIGDNSTTSTSVIVIGSSSSAMIVTEKNRRAINTTTATTTTISSSSTCHRTNTLHATKVFSLQSHLWQTCIGSRCQSRATNIWG
jgi:hypothetical protein